MKELWNLFCIAIVLSWMIDNRNLRLSQCNPKRKDVFFTFCLILLLTVFSGLRLWYNDTVTYLQIFEQIRTLPEYVNHQYAFSNGYLFGWLTSFVKTIGFSSQDYLMFYSALIFVPYILFLRQYCHSMIFGVFLMFASGSFAFSIAAIKQSVATALCLCAVTSALDKKWFRYLLLVTLAVMFHPYAAVYLLVPFMMFRPWTARTVFSIVLFVSIGFLLDSMLGVVVDITTMIGANYNESTLSGSGVNIFRVFVSFTPLLLSTLYVRPLFRNSTPENNLFFNLAMLNALIMFVGLFGTANYFARLANYFLPAQFIVLPWMLNKLPSPRDRRLLKFLCVLGYLGYFYYGHAIQHSFDASFSRLTVLEYLTSHF